MLLKLENIILMIMDAVFLCAVLPILLEINDAIGKIGYFAVP